METSSKTRLCFRLVINLETDHPSKTSYPSVSTSSRRANRRISLRRILLHNSSSHQIYTLKNFLSQTENSSLTDNSFLVKIPPMLHEQQPDSNRLTIIENFGENSIKTESTRSSSNNWTKTLYQDYLHCIENFCRALFNIF